MPLRDGYIPGVPCWVDVSEPDPVEALDFYGDLFGWEFEDVMPPNSDGVYFIARGRAPGSSIFDLSGQVHGGDVAAVRSIPEGAPAATWNTYFWVDSADQAASKVRDAGGGIVTDPFDFLDAAWLASFTDPEGAAFWVWEAKRHKGARLVNDPGALVFNGLNVRDVDGAKSFYGSVFGWQTGSIGGGLRAGRCPGTVAGSSANTTRTCVTRWRGRVLQMGSRTWSRASSRSRTISPRHRHIGA
jgi:uncharacterized protein